MSKIFVKRAKHTDVNEDNAQQTQTTGQQAVQQNSSENPKVEEARSKILQLQSTLQQKEQQFNMDKANIEKQIALLNQTIVNNGGNPTIAESAQYENHYKKLWESANDNDTIELCDVIHTVFDDLDEISYYPSDKECMNFTRKILPILNKKWNDGKEHWTEIVDDIIDKFKTASLSSRELTDVISKFKELLQSNPNFKYIFGL